MGGHCIGIDPYYLTYRAEQFGYRSQIILSGRRINDDMGKYIADSLVKLLIQNDVPVKGAKVAILGFTFKENCPDARNTKVIDIYRELAEYGVVSAIVDPQADVEEVKRLYGIRLYAMEDVIEQDAVILTVKHQEFEHLTAKTISSIYNLKHQSKIFMDVKGIYDRDDYAAPEWVYWRL